MTERPTFLYVLRPRGLPIVKIGCSVTPDKRREFFQRLWSIPLQLVASTPGTFADERAAHAELQNWRIHAEWFLLCPFVQQWLARHDLAVPPETGENVG